MILDDLGQTAMPAICFNKVKSLVAAILTITLLGCANTNAISENEALFQKHFQRELENRGFSIVSFPKMAEVAHTVEEADFFNAFVHLEKMNEHIYEPYASKYNLVIGPPATAPIKLAGARFSYWLFPNMTWEIMLKSTQKYMLNLESLLVLSPDEDKEFFSYVVAQENVQLQAFRLIVEDKNVTGATKLLADFVSQHEHKAQ